MILITENHVCINWSMAPLLYEVCLNRLGVPVGARLSDFFKHAVRVSSYVNIILICRNDETVLVRVKKA